MSYLNIDTDKKPELFWRWKALAVAFKTQEHVDTLERILDIAEAHVFKKGKVKDD